MAALCIFLFLTFFSLNAWLKLNNCPSRKVRFQGWRCPRAFSRWVCVAWWEYRLQFCGKQMNFTTENVMHVRPLTRPTWLRANYMCVCVCVYYGRGGWRQEKGIYHKTPGLFPIYNRVIQPGAATKITNNTRQHTATRILLHSFAYTHTHVHSHK